MHKWHEEPFYQKGYTDVKYDQTSLFNRNMHIKATNEITSAHVPEWPKFIRTYTHTRTGSTQLGSSQDDL